MLATVKNAAMMILVNLMVAGTTNPMASPMSPCGKMVMANLNSTRIWQMAQSNRDIDGIKDETELERIINRDRRILIEYVRLLSTLAYFEGQHTSVIETYIRDLNAQIRMQLPNTNLKLMAQNLVQAAQGPKLVQLDRLSMLVLRLQGPLALGNLHNDDEMANKKSTKFKVALRAVLPVIEYIAYNKDDSEAKTRLENQQFETQIKFGLHLERCSNATHEMAKNNSSCAGDKNKIDEDAAFQETIPESDFWFPNVGECASRLGLDEVQMKTVFTLLEKVEDSADSCLVASRVEVGDDLNERLIPELNEITKSKVQAWEEWFATKLKNPYVNTVFWCGTTISPFLVFHLCKLLELIGFDKLLAYFKLHPWKTTQTEFQSTHCEAVRKTIANIGRVLPGMQAFFEAMIREGGEEDRQKCAEYEKIVEIWKKYAADVLQNMGRADVEKLLGISLTSPRSLAEIWADVDKMKRNGAVIRPETICELAAEYTQASLRDRENSMIMRGVWGLIGKGLVAATIGGQVFEFLKLVARDMQKYHWNTALEDFVVATMFTVVAGKKLVEGGKGIKQLLAWEQFMPGKRDTSRKFRAAATSAVHFVAMFIQMVAVTVYNTNTIIVVLIMFVQFLMATLMQRNMLGIGEADFQKELKRLNLLKSTAEGALEKVDALEEEFLSETPNTKRQKKI